MKSTKVRARSDRWRACGYSRMKGRVLPPKNSARAGRLQRASQHGSARHHPDPLHSDYENSRTFFNTLSPSGRTGSTKDIVDAVLYLTDAGFISGVALPVDGGATAGTW